MCTLVFDANGYLTSISFNAPARDNAPQQMQSAGFAFTVNSLASGTTYNYTLTAKDSSGNALKTENGSFTTAGEPQGIDEINSSSLSQKVIRDGQVLIRKGREDLYPARTRSEVGDLGGKK